MGEEGRSVEVMMICVPECVRRMNQASDLIVLKIAICECMTSFVQTSKVARVLAIILENYLTAL